jgi:hypothetical protein
MWSEYILTQWEHFFSCKFPSFFIGQPKRFIVFFLKHENVNPWSRNGKSVLWYNKELWHSVQVRPSPSYWQLFKVAHQLSSYGTKSATLGIPKFPLMPNLFCYFFAKLVSQKNIFQICILFCITFHTISAQNFLIILLRQCFCTYNYNKYNKDHSTHFSQAFCEFLFIYTV